jgi:subtilase family serine protease
LKNIEKRFLLSSLVLMMILSAFPLLINTAYSRYAAPNEAEMPPTFSLQPAQATQSPQGYNVTQIRSAYNLPSSGGSGTIAIIDAYNDPTVMYDLNVFSTYYGLPNVTSETFIEHNMTSSIPPPPRQGALGVKRYRVMFSGLTP